MSAPHDLAGRLAVGVPLVAVPLSDAVTDGELIGAAADGLDVAELRIDLFSSTDPAHVVDQIGRFAAFPTVATIRSATEGGCWEGSDEARLALFERVVGLVDGVDVELSSTGMAADVVALARAKNKVVIISSHDFDGTPPIEELTDRARRAHSIGADHVKLATTATSVDDMRTLAQFTLDHHEAGPIVVAMGAQGPASRVLLPLLGSRLTYASLGPPVVSGQMSLTETVALLARLGPATSGAAATLSPP